MKSNFTFLHDTFPVLANFGTLAEEYCYSDSNSCFMKLGMIGETIVNLIFSYDRIPLPYDNTAVNRIDILLKEGLITRDLSDILGENLSDRPLLSGDKQHIYDLYQQRIHLYRKYAHHTISNTNTAKEAAERIAAIYERECKE